MYLTSPGCPADIGLQWQWVRVVFISSVSIPAPLSSLSLSFIFCWETTQNSRSTVVSYWRKCVHKYWLTAKMLNRPAQEKCELVN